MTLLLLYFKLTLSPPELYAFQLRSQSHEQLSYMIMCLVRLSIGALSSCKLLRRIALPFPLSHDPTILPQSLNFLPPSYVSY